jgi:hypothetical protein
MVVLVKTRTSLESMKAMLQDQDGSPMCLANVCQAVLIGCRAERLSAHFSLISFLLRCLLAEILCYWQYCGLPAFVVVPSVRLTARTSFHPASRPGFRSVGRFPDLRWISVATEPLKTSTHFHLSRFCHAVSMRALRFSSRHPQITSTCCLLLRCCQMLCQVY